MDRVEFTKKIVKLIQGMIDAGEHPIIDFVKRSAEEQHRLWKIGRDETGKKIGSTITDCDGFKKLSPHQGGKAMDIYFIGKDGKLSDPIYSWEYWHEWWEKMGGQKMIKWDKMHFEG